MKNIYNYNGNEWEKYAARLSGENVEYNENQYNNLPVDPVLEKYWKNAEMKNYECKINVDMAWNKVYSKIEQNSVKGNSSRYAFLRIAALAFLLIGLGTGVFYFIDKMREGTVVIATGPDDKNKEVILPDGSKVWLNRNSELSFSKKPENSTRKVKLTGEGFFEIKHDASNPFIVNTGKASVKVLGTSFNIITRNPAGELEVFVESGTVLITISREDSLIVEPGYIGKTNNDKLNKILNDNRNYLSWRTDLLVYEGAKLGEVFNDLKRVYDINISADDSSIYEKTITAIFDNEPQDTIINIICTTFNLSFVKDGKLFRLSAK